MKRREFIKLATVTSLSTIAINAQRPNVSSPFGLSEATISDLQAKMSSGEMSAKEIVAAYLKRIGSVNSDLNAIIATNTSAIETAEKLDVERKAGKVRSHMHGIPVLLKDNIDTTDRIPTTAGSLALTDNYAKIDAFLVGQLRKAGAVILGKTNLSEWANFRSSNSTSGWSGVGGQTKNPYFLDRNPCGSSSGTGSAISANLAVVGVGTETDGSIVCPSNSCGLVGIKPTVGLVSRSGIIPISHTQDTAGPMARTVTDAVILLNAMIGTDTNDSVTRLTRTNASIKDYTPFLKTNIKGKTIGIAKEFFGKNAAVDKIIEATYKRLEKSGAKLIDVKFPNLNKFGDAEYEVLLYEFKAGLNKYLSTATTKHKTLKDLIEFNEKNASKEMPHFKQEIFLQAEAKGNLTERKYKLALQKCQIFSKSQGIDLVVNQHKLDAILAPTGGPAWMTDLVNGDCGSHYIGSSSIAAVAGYPAITVPVGFVGGLPFGVSFFGKAWSEPILINIAFAFEQITKARATPMFLQSSQ
jgi:amidase